MLEKLNIIEGNYYFDSDSPINTVEEDKLNRTQFISNLKEFILNYKKEDCLTIGLTGSWGSGKTSILNMVINQDKKNSINSENYLIIKFNPWNFTTQNNLIEHFFNLINEKICEYESSKRIHNKIKNEFIKYLNLIKDNGELNLGIHLKVFDMIYKKQLSKKSIEKTKEEIINKLKKRDYKIIIIIDDIDRLTDTEIQQTFLLTRSLADFPNFIYILSFDRNVVINSLKNVQEDMRESFLDKIIQVMIPIPKISRYNLELIFYDEIEKLYKTENISYENDLNNILYYITRLIFNIRDIKRLMNVINFYMPLIKNEINVSNFIAITALQLFENDVYQEIKNNKCFFTSINYTEHLNNNSKDEKDKLNNIIELTTKMNKKEDLNNFLKLLFPQLNRIESNIHYGSDSLSIWHSELRICSKYVFDKYFSFTLEEFEISNHTFQNIIKSNNYETIKDNILSINNEGKTKSFIEKLKDNCEKIPKENIKIFLRLIFDIGEFLNIEYNNSLLDKYSTLSICNSLLLHELGENTDKYMAFEYAISNSTESLYLLVDELAIQNKRHGRHGFSKDKPRPEDIIFNEEQFDTLEKLASYKIKIWAYNKNLFETQSPILILYAWSFWNPNELTKFIEKLLVNNHDVMKLIECSFKIDESKFNKSNNLNPILKTYLKQTYTNMDVDTVKISFHFNMLNHIYPLDKIYNKVQEVKDKINNNTEKEICKLFIKRYEEHITEEENLYHPPK